MKARYALREAGKITGSPPVGEREKVKIRNSKSEIRRVWRYAHWVDASGLPTISRDTGPSAYSNF
jgi:hypothetical protein